MKSTGQRYQEVSLRVVGSNIFGRHPTMNAEETFNMIVSDEWLVPFGGFKKKLSIAERGTGRELFSSLRLNTMFSVVNNKLYGIDSSFGISTLGTLATYGGEVYIEENNAGQIAISDLINLYIYDSQTNAFTTLTFSDLGFVPGLITFQNGRFIVADLNSNQWRLSEPNNGLSYPFESQFVGTISTKSTKCKGCVRFPGLGNLLMVMGSNVCEQWTDVGAQLFPYQRSQSTNTDYGVLNGDTIDSLENMICWVGINEKSGPAIMHSNGAAIKKISTDGIDFRLAALKHPAECFGYMLRLNGHVFYSVTWPLDNVSYLYDFNTDKFFTISDENQGAFPAKRFAFFQNNYYFISDKTADLYLFRGDLFTYDYGHRIEEIPMIRITNTVRMLDQSAFNAGYAGFTIQQGNFPTNVGDTNEVPHIDLALSKDGGVNYGSYVSKPMNPLGRHENRLLWRKLGFSNALTCQFRFHGQYSPFFASDGIMGIYQ